MLDVAIAVLGPLACACLGWLLRDHQAEQQLREERRAGWDAGRAIGQHEGEQTSRRRLDAAYRRGYVEGQDEYAAQCALTVRPAVSRDTLAQAWPTRDRN